MSLRIVFAGTPEFALPTLQALIDSKHTVVAVYTQPDRPAGRGQAIQQSPIKTYALTEAIPVYQPLNFKSADEQLIFKNLQADVMVVVAYGLILPKAILSTPKFGCLNIHGSLLPRWRGAAPIQRAILAGDTTTGITIMQMDEGLDTGDMLSFHAWVIESQDTTKTLHDKLAILGKAALLDALDLLEKNALNPQKQDALQATYAAKILKAEAKINWQESAIILERKIRGFNPWPVAFTEIAGQTIRIFAAQILAKYSAEKPGTIVEITPESVVVATGEGTLSLLEIQLPGKKRLPIKDVLHSSKIFKMSDTFN
jgi:methionyl-tRNA formyltransferase